MTTILQEFVARRARPAQATGTDVFTALIGLFARSNAGATAATSCTSGIVLTFLGFAGGAFEREEQVLLPRRQVVEVGALHGALPCARTSRTTARSRW